MLEQTAGAVRTVYNLALEQRRDWWRQFHRNTGGWLNSASQGRDITKLRSNFAWLKGVHCTPLHQALRDLDKAFAGFVTGRTGFPRWRTKGQDDTFRIKGDELKIRKLSGRWSLAYLPKIGWVKFRDTRERRGEIRYATIRKDGLAWCISISCLIDHECATSDLPPVGIDRGVANTLSLSTGELISTPRLTALDLRKKRAQRILARRRRGSNRYLKQRQRLSRVTAKIARCRADWRHKTTTDIASRFGSVVLEDLKTAAMTRAGKHKRGLNRSILEQGWAAFATTLEYKLEERGGTLIKVNPAYTSQTCSDCGTIDKASRESQASFACRHCGFAAHADTNAAINILRRSTASMRAEGSGYRPDETRTVNHEALAA